MSKTGVDPFGNRSRHASPRERVSKRWDDLPGPRVLTRRCSGHPVASPDGNTLGCNSDWGHASFMACRSERCRLQADASDRPPGRYGELWTDSHFIADARTFVGLTGTYYDKDLTDSVFSVMTRPIALITDTTMRLASRKLVRTARFRSIQFEWGAWTDEAMELSLLPSDADPLDLQASTRSRHPVGHETGTSARTKHEVRVLRRGVLGKLRKYQNVCVYRSCGLVAGWRLTDD